MTTAQADGSLTDLFALERLDARTFAGVNDVVQLPQLFGGQLVGQSLVAGGVCAGSDKRVHSTHTTFLRPGARGVPVAYTVETLREGRQLAAYEVSARQGDRLVCRTVVSASVDDDGIAHTRPAPRSASPETSIPLEVLAAEDGGLGDYWSGFGAVEVRIAPIDDETSTPHSAAAPRNVWMRATDALPDDPLLHRAALAYASDLMMMATAVAPHGAVTGHERSLAEQWWAVSLDHALWFQGEVRADQWLLFEHTTPMAHAGRALVQASVFDTAGAAVCQVTQEALVRALP